METPIESLPRLILIGDRFTDQAVWDRILEVAEVVPWIHLRDHEADSESFSTAAAELVERIRMVAPGTMLSVNGRLDVAEELGLGYHVGTHGESIAKARKRLPVDSVIGFSAHYVTEAQQAIRDGADYVFFSPIFASPSKPGHVGVGLDELRTFTERIQDIPVFAVGGVTPERVRLCLEAGAHGVAVLSGILQQDDVERAALDYLDEL